MRMGSSWFIDSIELPETGTYTIDISNGSQTGSVSVQVVDATPQTGTITVGGSAVTLTLGAGQDANLTFSGTSGQQVSLLWSNSTLNCPTVSIMQPNGIPLATSNWCGSSSFIDVQTLPTTGTYTVNVDTGSQTHHCPAV